MLGQGSEPQEHVWSQILKHFLYMKMFTTKNAYWTKKVGHCLKSVIALRYLFSIHNILRQHLTTTWSSFSDVLQV